MESDKEILKTLTFIRMVEGEITEKNTKIFVKI